MERTKEVLQQLLTEATVEDEALKVRLKDLSDEYEKAEQRHQRLASKIGALREILETL